MGIVKWWFLLLFPVFVFSHTDADYIHSFASHFQKGQFRESLQILDDWQTSHWHNTTRILGMKAAVYLSMGDLETSKGFMDACVQNLESEHVSDPLLEEMLQIYYKVLENPLGELPTLDVLTCAWQRQPKGVRLRYWFGVGQILVGLIAAPFSGGASAGLIVTGTSTLVDAISDAATNQENWEKELNERQRNHPDVQNNSFTKPPRVSIPRLQLI